MDIPANVYFYIVPLVVFGPLFLWLFYNFGARELFKIPEQMRRKQAREQAEAAQFAAERLRKRGSGPSWISGGPNKSPSGFVMQAITFAWFAALIGFFASSPPYVYKDPQAALIKLSLSHPGQRKVECRKRSLKELRELAPNMRAALSCPRERWPVSIELELDGTVVFAKTTNPAGLSADGPSSFYQTLAVSAGAHRLEMRLRDQGSAAFRFTATHELQIAARQVIAVQFNAAKGGFTVK